MIVMLDPLVTLWGIYVMPENRSSFKTNLIYGAIVLIPISIVIVVVVQLFEFLDHVAEGLALRSALDAGAAMLIIFFLLLLICYLIGAFIHTQLGTWSFERLENRVLKQVPLYKVISGILKGYATQEQRHQPALIQTGMQGAAQMGIVIEENDNDTITVFIPSIPVLTVGTLLVVERARVKPLDVGYLEYLECLGEWGVGSRKLLGNIEI